ncbi:response regulator [Microcoleus sp. bin38.metabat.b11b12b14.051]|uniref:response regulator n=1 Tax=Microcoleus sp. bin38.metabat.b11b12b14.051 TaxID=2742709 RepID=UPI0025EB78F7|nr:response regulator [Microcoleus sp. bin38.metabat.b11b12b14.051]
MLDIKIAKHLDILLVKDSPSHGDLALENQAQSNFFNKLYVVENAVSAINFLKQEGLSAGVPSPCLILLDLNLPKKIGLEVLAEINSDPELKMIPVVMTIASAADDREIVQSCALSARCYPTKPADFSQVSRLVKWIEDSWLAVATVPK